MKLTNNQIYEYGQKLAVFNECNIKMPVRINFYLQKNIQLIQQAAKEIDAARLSIGAQYGIPSDNGGYDIPLENMAVVNQEMNDLFALEQDINLHIFNLNEFDNIELTYKELSAIMFIIEE